jgi:hypothetical protein
MSQDYASRTSPAVLQRGLAGSLAYLSSRRHGAFAGSPPKNWEASHVRARRFGGGSSALLKPDKSLLVEMTSIDKVLFLAREQHPSVRGLDQGRRLRRIRAVIGRHGDGPDRHGLAYLQDNASRHHCRVCPRLRSVSHAGPVQEHGGQGHPRHPTAGGGLLR